MLIESVDEEWFLNIIKLAYNTGMRQMEIITLRWQDVDFISKSITISNQVAISKSKKIRVIPMNGKVIDCLRLQSYESSGDYVFTYMEQQIKRDHISKKFKKHIRRLDINQSLNFHSLRHTSRSKRSLHLPCK